MNATSESDILERNPRFEDFMLPHFYRSLLSLLLPVFLLSFSPVPSQPLPGSSEAARAAACPPDGCSIYMPLLLKYMDQVLNGDFESGPTAWNEYSASGFFTIYPYPGEPRIPPHSGSWEAWLAGIEGETASIDQNIYVSSARPFLQYWQWIVSEDPDCSKDDAEVLIDSLVLLRFNLCQSANSSNWEMQTLDLSAYSGRVVNLKFLATTDADESTISSLYLDDISLQGSP
jgi:hypothetical protein